MTIYRCDQCSAVWAYITYDKTRTFVPACKHKEGRKTAIECKDHSLVLVQLEDLKDGTVI